MTTHSGHVIKQVRPNGHIYERSQAKTCGLDLAEICLKYFSQVEIHERN